jgi:Zn-dependent peptidase ImmA (M78 family)
MAYETLSRNGLGEHDYTPPTPVELLVDNEDGVLYRIEELKSDARGNPLVLGLTGWDENGNRQIVINSMLADSSRESDVHRFNFTLGHEFFHAIEHLPRVPREAVAPMARTQLYGALFVDGERVRHRSAAARAVDSWAGNAAGPRGLTTDEDWREWQANVFSSSLLMPEWAVKAEFQVRLGTEDVAVDPPTNPRDFALQVAGERVFQSKIYDRSLADLFAVSRQAMAIRLLELGLVKEGEG